jgi:hypothetical protein
VNGVLTDNRRIEPNRASVILGEPALRRPGRRLVVAQLPSEALKSVSAVETKGAPALVRG